MLTDKRQRTLLLALLFFTVVINYMDRINISVAASAIRGDLGLSKESMGIIFSAWAWTYTGFQIPGGIVADRFKARVLYPILLVGWSLATIVQGFVSSLGALVGCRVFVGAFEAPSYPINNKVVTQWFPPNQRASAISIYTSGQFIGLAFLAPVLTILLVEFGWRNFMIATGIMGVLWAVVWFVLYPKTKEDNKKTNEDGSQEEVVQRPQAKIDLPLAFSHSKLWGLYIGQFAIGSVFIFFLTWFPTYLTDYRGIEIVKSGFMSAVPYLGAFAGVLLAGFSSDAMSRRGISEEIARKAPVMLGLVFSTAIIGANFTTNNNLAIAFLTISFFGVGLASITWVFVSLIAPDEYVGMIGGVFNFFGGTSAIITPFLIGVLISDDNFAPAFFYIGTVAVLGFLSYLFIVGKVEKIELKTDKPLEA
ncbi:MFS transporter [Hirschia litorea]|uniref:MFS transporter n=1 Tax=Hirschia litorea TaxID=1199156 RepID=A0ABW2IPE6_9PROT